MKSKIHPIWNFLILFVVFLTIFLYARIYIEDRDLRARIEYSRRLSTEMKIKKPGAPLPNFSDTGVSVRGRYLQMRNPSLTQAKASKDFEASFSNPIRLRRMRILNFEGVIYSDEAGRNYWKFNFSD